jgi:ABC-type glycerol-3-phosphate transport system substrate-binding protein
MARAQQRLGDSGQVVTMYAQDWTPTAGGPTAQHPLVYHALQVLADNFKAQTGITIKFVQPICGTIVQTCLTQTQTYYTAQIAAGTAPDVAIQVNAPIAQTAGYWMNLDPYLSKPDPYNTAVKDWCHNFAFSELIKPGDKCQSHYRDAKGNFSIDVPVGGSYPGLVIGEMANKQLLLKAGVAPVIPTDWSDWMRQLATIKSKGLNPMGGEATSTGAAASSWPFWSALWPAYMGHVYHKVNPNGVPDGSGTSTKDGATPLQVAKAIENGVISADDPMYQAMFRQVKIYMSYWVKGWQTADVLSLWRKGNLAERQFFIGDLFGEYSNPDRKFDLVIGFPPYPTRKTAPNLARPFGSLPTGAEARTANAGWGNSNSFGIITSAVQRDHNADAAVRWLQYITAPQQDVFIVNEHPTFIPMARGTGDQMAVIYKGLNSQPVPDWRSINVYPFGLTQDATPNLEKELQIWVTGQENDKTFFAHMEAIMMAAAKAVTK